MNYRETVEYLFTHLPMFQRIGAAAYKKDLTNTLTLCNYLGNPQHLTPTIHVGGTNGKGSVSHMLASVCQAAGLKTGLFISPHYKDIRERIKINGEYITQKAVVSFVEKMRPEMDRIGVNFFEMMTVLAFEYFAQEKVDIAIIEVGLGGRTDSTNIITPLMSVITNISYDHMDFLGNTLTLIAGEKAGIIKPGVPVVIGETQEEPAPVFIQTAEKLKAPIVFADQHYRLEESEPNRMAPLTCYRVLHNEIPWQHNLKAEAGGPYQIKNIATVIQAVEVLQQLAPALPGKLPQLQNALTTALPEGLSNLKKLTRFMGRWQIIGENPAILADSAHNEAGLRLAFGEIAQYLNARPNGKLHVVAGFVNDKDLSKALPMFPQHARYYFAKANVQRGMEAKTLQENAQPYGLKGRAYSSVRNALKAAKNAAGPDDFILVIGSIFVVAEVL